MEKFQFASHLKDIHRWTQRFKHDSAYRAHRELLVEQGIRLDDVLFIETNSVSHTGFIVTAANTYYSLEPQSKNEARGNVIKLRQAEASSELPLQSHPHLTTALNLYASLVDASD